MIAFLKLLELCGLLRFINFGVDYTITVANVLQVSGSQLRGTALEAITAGQPLYTDGTTGLFGTNVGLASATVSGKNVCLGISLHGALTGQPINYSGSAGDVIGFGAIFTVNTMVIVSTNVGKLAPISDNASGWKTFIAGCPKTTSQLTLIMFSSGVAT